MNHRGHDIGVCSWSLRPKNISELVAGVGSLGLSHIQLALAPLLTLAAQEQEAELRHLHQSGLQLTATMISFADEDYDTIETIHQTGGYLADATWPQRRKITAAAARLSAELGCRLLTTHIGFVPSKTDAAGYGVMLDRVRQIAADLEREHVTLLLETGQEKAGALLAFLEDLKVANVGVNFDPANMILYGAGDPIEAIGVLGKYIHHVHVKDGTASSQPGKEWGKEVPFNTGQVAGDQFLAALSRAGYRGPLVIEREAGEQRLADVKAAIEAIKKL
jgi:L-ribulose-5-phosphate 3-epimerase